MPTDVQSQRRALNGPTMGTRFSAVFYAESVPAGLAGALQAAVDSVDAQMSTWKPDSDLMRFNRAEVGEWVAVPHDLLRVVETSLAIGRITDGAFDIGVFDLIDAWGFNQRGGLPDAARIGALAASPRRHAHDVIEVDAASQSLRKLAPIAIDLSGIAKGYGVDRLAETMTAFDIRDFIVSIDGEVRAKGRKPDGSLWKVAIEAPIEGRREAAGAIDLEDAALATSGDYRHTVRLGNQSYAHTMDPRTGRPLSNNVQAVTVRAPTCMQADAWATVGMVIGADALPLINRLGMQCLIAERIEAETAA